MLPRSYGIMGRGSTDEEEEGRRTEGTREDGKGSVRSEVHVDTDATQISIQRADMLSLCVAPLFYLSNATNQSSGSLL